MVQSVEDQEGYGGSWWLGGRIRRWSEWNEFIKGLHEEVQRRCY